MPPVGTAILPSRTSAAVFHSPIIATANPSPTLLGLRQQPRKRGPTSRRHNSSRLCVQAVGSSLDDVQMRSRDEAKSKDDLDRVQLDPSVQLPEEWRAAVDSGKVSPVVQQRYVALAANPLLSPFLRWQGFEERLLADPGFMVKVAIEVGVGLCTKTTAEATKRGPAFFNELDFVMANIAMALLADFCLVWLPAPSVSWRTNVDTAVAELKKSPIFEFIDSCPDNCFQKVQPGSAPFTTVQRVGALAVNGGKLLAVGTVASLVGVGAINALMGLRQQLDPGWVPLNPPQNIVATSLAYGTYMGISSNFRYQVIAGIIEERGIEVWFSNPRVRGICSFLIRTSNTFIGSLLWVDFIRYTV